MVNDPDNDVTESKHFLPRLGLTEDVLTKLSWLFIILPGFLAYTCLSLISPSSDHTDFEIAAYSFGFLLVSLAISFPIYVAASWSIAFFGKQIGLSREKLFNAGNLIFYVVLTAASILIGVGAGINAERDSFYKFAKLIPFVGDPIQDSIRHPIDRILLQNQTGLNHYSNPRPDSRFYEEDRPARTFSTTAFARLTLENGAIFEGWPLYFDARRDDAQIYMSPACRLVEKSSETSVLPVMGPGVVVYERDIIHIEFVDTFTTVCSSYWYTPPGARQAIAELRDIKTVGGETDPVLINNNRKQWKENQEN